MIGHGFFTAGYVDMPDEGGGGGGGGDTAPPTVTIISAPETPADPIVVRVTDADPGLGYLGLFALLPGHVDEVTVLRRGVFRGSFSGEVVVDGDDTEVTIYRTGGLPVGVVRFSVDALDGDGNDEAAP